MRLTLGLGKAEPIYLTAQIRAIEQIILAQQPRINLMERAGEAAAERARHLLGESGSSALILAGPGNNGGDAFIVARLLKRWWYDVDVVFAGVQRKLPLDAAEALRMFVEAGGQLLDQIPATKRYQLVVDGLFGIGLTRDVDGEHAALIEQTNALGTNVLALDIPSGLDSDTGAIKGTAIRAQHTVTFIGLKPGLLTLDGPDHRGMLQVANLGLDAEALLQPEGRLIEQATVARLLAPRCKNSHKGNYGNVAVIGGAEGMVGAALLGGRAALKLGAGRVLVGMLASGTAQVDLLQPELMLRDPFTLVDEESLSCIVVGPGLGQSEDAKPLLHKAIESSLPLVLDADALNVIAGNAHFHAWLQGRQGPTILTPHPAEAARLLGTNTAAVQQSRVGTAKEIAQRFKCAVVLKGVGSVCALASGRWWINSSGNPGMASAGMGDVLSGMLGALLAQGLTVDQALLLGVYVHGAAADACVESGRGPIGLTASEVSDEARNLLNHWTQETICRS